MVIGALILGIFSVIGTALVSLTYINTKERIIENERLALLRSLHQIIDEASHDNDIYGDVITMNDRALLGSKDGVAIYRARRGGQPVAAVIASTAPDGYSGTIKLLVGINYDGTLAGVRVVSHRETPGLGDGIEAERSDWILGFNGRSLINPDEGGWRVKKDGGTFDQFTGATITPRAVVRAVHNTLRYYQQHREAIFDDGSRNTPEAEAK
ncbi:MAG: electron transport complex subunit RsxG [Chromatiales bacterium]|nr:electron transport complex subunit RsxG [Chromatiales bacterium]